MADTDMLSDRLWVKTQNFFGQKLLNAFANNGDFFVNTVDNLTGSSDLISIRGRGTSNRPFTRVEELKQAADDRFRVKERELRQELTDRNLSPLLRGKGGQTCVWCSDGSLVVVCLQHRINHYLKLLQCGGKLCTARSWWQAC